MGKYYEKKNIYHSINLRNIWGMIEGKKNRAEGKSSSFHVEKHNTQEPEPFTRFLRSLHHLHHHHHFLLHADGMLTSLLNNLVHTYCASVC